MNSRLLSGFFFLLIFIFATSLSSQDIRWSQAEDVAAQRVMTIDQQIIPYEYSVYTINFDQLTNFLVTDSQEEFVFDIPMPQGEMERFVCTPSTLFSKGLAEKYASIVSFDGTSERKNGMRLKMGLSPKGFHAMILVPGSSNIFIDVYSPGNTNYYKSYYKKDYDPQEIFTCGVEDNITTEEVEHVSAGDCMLRTYRLALACTGEYATFHGGTTESVLAEFAIAMGRVNGIYERDLGITMILIDNTDEVIFFDADNDPYTNNNGGTMLGENQETLDEIIGSANYDIGHVFSTGGGGIAALQSPCNGNRKAQGVTGLNSPVNDPFYVDYVCHEIGHQFGGNHTQNNSCNRNGNTAMEVGSANTIMGYAGICTPNSKNASDDHFHAISVLEVANFVVNGNGGSCGESMITTNTAPEATVNATTYVVPVSTPFVLDVSATDADGDILSYCWEQFDNEVADMPPASTNTEGPAFISNSPLDVSERYFPNLDAIVNNAFFEWEVLPSVSREMNFRCTVRDNNIAVGCTDEVDVELTFAADAGPFLVLNPNNNVTWNATDTEIIMWDVAGTDVNPVNCSMVDILLSTDGGFTYDIVIAENVENNGMYEIVVPDEFTSTARIMIKCSDNVFFDISDMNFTITTPFNVQINVEEFELCQGENAEVVIDLEGFEGFSEEVALSLENAPVGLDASFSQNPVSVPGSTTLLMNDIDLVAGVYEFAIVAVSSTITISKQLSLTIQSMEVDDLLLVSPVNGMKELSNAPVLEWSAAAGIVRYNIEIAENPLFVDATVISNYLGTMLEVPNLKDNTVYYWRVQAQNSCAGDPRSDIFAFQTLGTTSCDMFESADTPIIIDENEAESIFSSLVVENVDSYESFRCNINIDHSWIGDLIITLFSPDGEGFVLVDRIGVPDSQFGCNDDDMIIQFSNESGNSAEELENTCGDFQDNYQPVDQFNEFESVGGAWTLQVEDAFNQDGGALLDWNIELCVPIETMDPLLENNGLIVENGGNSAITMQKLFVSGDNDEMSVYTIIETTQQGDLQIDPDGSGTFVVLEFGSTFTQQDINDGRVIYQHGVNPAIEDTFVFDVVDSDGNWSQKSDFNILISQGEVIGAVNIVNTILCNEGSDGEISVEITGGTGPFSYSIDGIDYQVDSIFTGLSAGTYEVMVKDIFDIIVYESSITLNEPDLLLAQATLTFYSVEVSATGGTGTYTYSIDGVEYQVNPFFFDLPNGDYVFYVKDENGCISTVDQSVEIPALTASAVATEIACFGDSTATITIDASGGFVNYVYSLTGTSYQSENSFMNLPAGDYTVWVKDAGAFTIQIPVSIIEPDVVELAAEYTGGNIEILATGGTEPYAYSIDGGINFQAESTFLVDMDGTYPIVVVDANGCMDISEVILSIVDLQDEFIDRNVEVYPVPFTDKFTIHSLDESLNLSQATFRVMDMVGKDMVFEAEASQTKAVISINEWPQGQYLLMVEWEEKYVLRKILK